MTTLARLRAAQRRGDRRGAKGFTLLELVVVAALASVLFLMLIRWILTLSAASTTTLDNTSARRSADVAMSAFASDVASGVPCQSGGTGPLALIYPDRVALYQSSPSDPSSVQLVVWQIAARNSGDRTSGVLTRSVATHIAGSSDPCNVGTYLTDPSATGNVTTQGFGDPVQSIDTGSIVGALADTPIDGTVGVALPGFVALTDGAPVAARDARWGSCDPASTLARCNAQTLSLNWVFLSAGDKAAPVSVTRSYTFAIASGGLR